MTDMGLPPVIQHPRYIQLLGIYHSNWTAVDLYTDCAIWQFLKVTPTQAHLITSGMMFGRKARLLADLVGRSDHMKKAAILGAFNKIRAGKRDIITHAYARADQNEVVFVERSIAGPYKAVEHRFTLAAFETLTLSVYEEILKFKEALGISPMELNAFAEASLSLSRKESKSPVRPTESA